MQPRGFGEYQPLPGEAPDSGRNRRVTMQVSGLESCPSNDNPTDEE
jgi:outer membrane protein OmpA-like peptidoglycan-associated protein